MIFDLGQREEWKESTVFLGDGRDTIACEFKHAFLEMLIVLIHLNDFSCDWYGLKWSPEGVTVLCTLSPPSSVPHPLATTLSPLPLTPTLSMQGHDHFSQTVWVGIVNLVVDTSHDMTGYLTLFIPHTNTPHKLSFYIFASPLDFFC